MLTNFLLPSPTHLQDAHCFFLNKAELEAKLESLKEEVEFLRTFYKEVRSLPGAPAIISLPSWILKLPVPEDGGRGGDTGQQSPLAVFPSRLVPAKRDRAAQRGSQRLRARPASLTSSTPCPHQETQQLRANTSETSVVVQMDNSGDLDLGGIAADVRAQYEDIARRSRAEAQAWYESKVRKPGTGRGCCTFSLQTSFRPRETPPTLLICSDCVGLGYAMVSFGLFSV